MKRVLITYRLKPEGLTVLNDKYELTLPKDRSFFSREEILELISEYDVLVPNFSFFTDKEIMDRGVNLELISNFGVGFNNIDVDYATRKGIVVTNKIGRASCRERV